MGEFFGRHTRRLDDCRLVVPRNWTDALGEEVYIVLWRDCLAVWSTSEYERFEAALRALERSGDQTTRSLVRMLAASTHADYVDNKNRIVIHDSLVQRIGSPRHVELVGAEDHIEVWPAPFNGDVSPFVDRLRSLTRPAP